MIEYNDEYGAYALELDDMTICWDDEPDDSAEQMAESVREAYHRNIRIIAEAVYNEIKDMFDVQDVDEVIAKLGKGLPVHLNTLLKICSVLNCSLDDIVDVSATLPQRS